MKTVYPLIFQTKISATQKVTNSNKIRYEEIITEIIGSEIELKNIAKYSEFSFIVKIPIENDLLPEQNVLFREFISENVIHNDCIVEENHFKNKDDILFFDLSSIGRENFIFSLLMQIIPLLEKNSEKNRIIILIDDLPMTFALSIVFYNDFILSEQLIVFDRQGRFANSEMEKHINKKKICELLFDQMPRIEELIRNKMISKIGHFRRTDRKGADICFRSYFDGQFCVEEISKFISSFIQAKVPQNPLIIIYYASNSSWLKEIIYIVVNKNITNKAIYIEINDLKDDTLKKHIYKTKGDIEIVFITDLLNTCETFKNHYIKISDSLPQQKTIIVHSLSILNNRLKSSENKNNVRKLVIQGKSVYVHYILDVDVLQKHVNNCELCRIGIPNSKFEEDYELKLTSFEFWELCHNSSYISEPFVPKRTNRDKILYYPNILSWIDKNGPYIAYKYKKILDANNISISNLALVLPDETKGQQKSSFIDTPSGRFANCLELIHGVEYIAIPRKILDYYSLHEIDGSIDDETHLWFRQLTETTCNLLIVDESHVKGGTYIAIKKILSYLNKKTIGYFPIIDFNPIHTLKIKERDPELHYLNLYEFQMLKTNENQ